jgi:hypothetical protein
VSPRWYQALVVVGVSLLSVLLSVLVSLRSAERAIDADHRAREVAAAETRAATCLVIVAQSEVYDGAEPISEAGRRAEKAWRNLRTLLQCD